MTSTASLDKYTKAQLIQMLHEYEDAALSLLEENEKLKDQTIQQVVATVKKEAVLLWEDLVKLGKFVYDLGQQAQQQLSTVQFK